MGGSADRLIALNLGQSSELACSAVAEGRRRGREKRPLAGQVGKGNNERERESARFVFLAPYPGLRKAKKRGCWRKGMEDKAPYVHEGASCERCGVSSRGRREAQAGGAGARA